MGSNVKNENYYNIQPMSLTSNLLDIADMLQDLKQPRISQLPNEQINELLFKGKLPFLENCSSLGL